MHKNRVFNNIDVTVIRHWLVYLLFCRCFFQSGISFAQTQDSTLFKNSIIPIAFFLPETSLGFGITGITTFRPSQAPKTERPSQIIYSAVYTLKNQILLFAPYEIYLNQQHVRLKGEIGYYRYFYNFYGVGPLSRTEDFETYSVNFPRIDFNYALSKNKKVYYGLGFQFDYFDIITEPNTFLNTTQPTGYAGGVKANLEALLFYDTRNNIFAPSKGSYLQFNVEYSLPDFISPFNYALVNLDFRTFIPLRDTWTLALRYNSTHASADTPFFDLPYLATPNRARGLNDRRFLVDNIISGIAELRYPLYKRFSGVAFTSTNFLYQNKFYDVNMAIVKLTAGIGIRYELSKTEKTSLRLDVATSDGDIQFYITTNEAF